MIKKILNDQEKKTLERYKKISFFLVFFGLIFIWINFPPFTTLLKNNPIVIFLQDWFFWIILSFLLFIPGWLKVKSYKIQGINFWDIKEYQRKKNLLEEERIRREKIKNFTWKKFFLKFFLIVSFFIFGFFFSIPLDITKNLKDKYTIIERLEIYYTNDIFRDIWI